MITYMYILLGIIGVVIVIAVVATIIASFSVGRKKESILKEISKKESLEGYEKTLKDFLGDNKISSSNLNTICEALKIRIFMVSQFNLKLGGAEALIDNNPHGDGYDVYVADNLDEAKQRFAIAHEIGHIVMNDTLPVGRKGHGIFLRSQSEQIRDYIAAAILLPCDEFKTMMTEANYDGLDEEQKEKFIDRVALERTVDKELVLKRIQECQILNSVA